MSRRSCRALPALAWLTCATMLPLAAQAPGGVRDVLTFQTFDKRGGLQASTIHALSLDRDGLMWVGTDDGAAFFTGHAWVRVDMPIGVEVNHVRDLLFTPDGAQWFATRGGGVIRFNGDTTHWTAGRGGLPDDRVYGLTYTTAFGAPTILAATYSGVARLEGDRFVPLALPPDFSPTGLVAVEVPAPGGGVELYLGSPNDGVLRYREGTWQRLGAAEGLATTSVEDLAVAVAPRPGMPRLYVAGTGGVFALVGDRWSRVEGAPAPAFRLAEVVRADSTRELWVGTTTGGLWRRLADGRWEEVQGGAIRPGDAVSMITPLPRGRSEPLVYVGIRGERLTRVGLTSAREAPVQLPVASRSVRLVRELLVAGRRELWLGTQAPGVIRVRDGTAVVEAADPALGLGAARAIARVGDAIWVSGDSGVVRLEQGRWIRADAGLGGAVPRRFGFDGPVGAPGTSLLLGSDRGAWIWRGDRWESWAPVPASVVDDFAQVIDTAEGALRTTLYVAADRGQIWEVRAGRAREMIGPRAAVAREQVTDLLVEPRPDGSRRLWAATTGQGGIRLLDVGDSTATWRLVDADVRAALPSEYVRDLVRGADGRIYAATSRGVAQLRPADDGTVALETLYGLEEGLPNADALKLAFLDTGELMVGTVFGVGRLTPATPDPLRELPLRLVVRAAGTGEALPQGAVLPHDTPGLVLEFALLNYFREEDTRYRTEVVGAPGGPSEWLARHEVTIPALAPGQYRFRVWARDYRGRVVGPVEHAFTVAPPWWKAPLALVGWVVLALGTFGGVLAWRSATARRRQRAVELREREARNNAARFRALFDRSLDAHLLLDGERIVAANPAAVRLLEAPDVPALLASAADAFIPPPPVVPGTGVVEVAVRRTDGSTVPAQAAWTPIPGDDGHTLLHVVLRDLSAERAAEADRARLEAQVREAQKFESLGTLAGGIAHDFNNLLTVIRGSAEEALDDAPAAATPLRRILDVSDRARDLVRQILTFSRRSPGGAHVPVDLAALVGSLESLIRSSLPRTVALTLDLAPGPVVVRGDPTQLQQMLLNLVANAEHAMRGRHGSLTIRVSRDGVDGTLAWLVVRDTGRGMAPEVLPRVFEPFFTTKPVGEGTGLGLAVLHGIVAAHGGSVGVESAVDRGTTFTITLPISTEAVPPPRRVAEPAGAGDGGGALILLVDDDPDVLGVTARLLRSLGYRAMVFAEPHRALEWLAGTRDAVAALVTDQTMPGMRGDQLAEAARAVRPGLPALIVTGFSHVLTAERIAASGVAAVLHKPVERAELGAAIRRAIEGDPAVLAGG